MESETLWRDLERACLEADQAAFGIASRLGDQCDKNGWSTLHYASFHGYQGLVEDLLGMGSNPCRLTSKRLTPLHMAAKGRHPQVMPRLLEAGCEPDLADHVGMTALHHAAWVGDAESVRCLLKFGALRDPVDLRGLTPLHVACRGNHGQVVWLLLEMGANAAHPTAEGLDALAVAKHSGATEALAYLRPWHERMHLDRCVAAAAGTSRLPERL